MKQNHSEDAHCDLNGGVLQVETLTASPGLPDGQRDATRCPDHEQASIKLLRSKQNGGGSASCYRMLQVADWAQAGSSASLLELNLAMDGTVLAMIGASDGAQILPELNRASDGTVSMPAVIRASNDA